MQKEEEERGWGSVAMPGVLVKQRSKRNPFELRVGCAHKQEAALSVQGWTCKYLWMYARAARGCLVGAALSQLCNWLRSQLDCSCKLLLAIYGGDSLRKTHIRYVALASHIGAAMCDAFSCCRLSISQEMSLLKSYFHPDVSGVQTLWLYRYFY